jgi:uncharacterized membrane protein YcaP (DUF421 family)
MNIETTDNGIDHIVINNGRINELTLKKINLSKEQIEQILSSEKLNAKDVYLMLIDDGGNVKTFRKREK